jgi:ML domain
MSASKLLALLCILHISGNAQAFTKWTQCGIAGSFQVTNASLTPQNIYPGNSARFTIDAVGAEHDVDDGKITMLVRLAGLPIYTQADDFCQKTTCPVVSKSETKIVYEQNFPEITPPGTYSVTLSGKSGSGEQLFCVIISFDVKAAPPLLENFGDDRGASFVDEEVFSMERIGSKLSRFFKSRKALYPYQ